MHNQSLDYEVAIGKLSAILFDLALDGWDMRAAAQEAIQEATRDLPNNPTEQEA